MTRAHNRERGLLRVATRTTSRRFFLMRPLLALVMASLFVTTPAAHAGVPVLTRVTDLTDAGGGSLPMDLTDVAGTLFFSAEDNQNGRQLWRSGGTTATTSRLTGPGLPAGAANPVGLTALDTTVLFSARDDSGRELWRTDGTPDGTTRVKDINNGPGDSSMDPFELWGNHNTPAVVGSKMFFAADDGTSGRELWVTDGTESGTRRVRDINPGSTGSSPYGFLTFDGRVFFYATDPTGGTEIWQSDGTEDGTTRLKDVNPGPDGSASESQYQPMVATATALYFRANGGTHGLWKSDGRSSGTEPLAYDPRGTSGWWIRSFGATEKRLFFSIYSQGTWRLWTTDGTPDGTRPAFDHNRDHNWGASPIATFGKRAFVSNGSLWASDGSTEENLWISASPGPADVGDSAVYAGALFFGASGAELWETDGTPGGTFLVRGSLGHPVNAGPWELTVSGGALFFVATGDAEGNELWRVDQAPPPAPGPLAPPGPPPPTPGSAGPTPGARTPVAGTTLRVAPRRITVRVRARRSRERVVYGVSGKLAVPAGVAATSACRGTVTLRIALRGKQLAHRRIAIRRSCTYSAELSVAGPKAQRSPALTVSFAGNTTLLPKRLAAIRLRPPG